MQAVILAAGKGTRMKDLTAEVPKPMLTVLGKTLLEHKFDALPAAIDEIILVIGYQGEVIREKFGNQYEDKRISYVVQETLDGTAGAVWKARDLIRDRFIVMMGDDLYARRDMERCVEASDWALVAEETKAMASGGRVVTNEAGEVLDIVEGDHQGTEGLMNTNLFVLDARVFAQPLVPKSPGSSEFGLPQTVLPAARALGIPLHVIPVTEWIQITAPEDLARAEERLRA